MFAIAAAVLLVRPNATSAQVPFGGTVRIVNRGTELLTVLLDRQVRATVAPQGTAVVPNVPGGYRILFLRNPQGRMRTTTRFFLAAGGSYTYTFGASVSYRPSAPTQPPPGVVPGVVPGYVPGAVPGAVPVGYQPPTPYGYQGYAQFGRVQVFNRFTVPVQVWIADRMYGVVGPSRTLLLNQVPAGNPILIARNAMNPPQVLGQQSLVVQAGLLVYANLMPTGGVLRVVNSHPVPVEIVVDGRPLRTVLPGQTLDIPDLPVGNRQLLARVGPQLIDQRPAPIYQGQTYTWYLRSNAGAVRIVNQTPEPLNVTLDNTPRGMLMPGQETMVASVPVGSHQLSAITTTGQVRSVSTMAVTPGETRSWFIRVGSGGHEPHAHPHAHPHQPGGHHHHEHTHPHPGGLDHHHQ